MRRALSGVSWGMSAFAFDDAREAVDPRGLKLETDDLCDTAADDRADLEVLVGMLSGCPVFDSVKS